MNGAIDWQTIQYAFSKLSPLNGEYERFSWNRNRQAFRQHVIQDDPRIMLRWSTIQATMFVGEDDLTRTELDHLIASDTMARYRIALWEDDFCAPPRMSEASYTSGNLVHQVTHLDIFERATGLRVEDANTILEFGGGYGAMCAVTRRLGFSGDYYIADLPELALLQAYYLSALGYPSYHIEMTDSVPENLPSKVDILFAFYSLSEVDEKLREDFFEAANPESCIIAYQPEFFGVDNEVFFSGFVTRHYKQYKWEAIDNPYMGGDSGYGYLVGVKN